ncbi:MAG: phosphate acyltransferase PlsX [Gemmatimonadales bacterium]|nr:phosphate acyltransferase PlsX [Gemmatimonadales bacterium]
MSENPRPIIAVDAMGGDHGPQVIVPGAVAALSADSPYDIVFYGNQVEIEAQLDQLQIDGLPVSVVNCTQDIAMEESPASAIRNKKDSPIVRAMVDQKAGLVRAVVSAGSTGAMVAGSIFILGRLPGIDRPAIASLIPTIRGELLLLDVGANVQCTPEHILSFAQMGEVFVREILKVERPTVGQLNIGEEAKKGTELCTASYELLAGAGFDFIGNVEGNQFMLGPCDVVVTDGFTGNNTLKLVEGVARFLGALSKRDSLTEAEKAAFKPVLGLLMRDFSYEPYGGAVLLGVAGISIIAHGRSSCLATTNAVKEAWKQIDIDLPAKLVAARDS